MIILEDDFERLPLFALRGIVEAEVSLTHRITVIGFESNPASDPQNTFPLRLKKSHCIARSGKIAFRNEGTAHFHGFALFDLFGNRHCAYFKQKNRLHVQLPITSR